MLKKILVILLAAFLLFACEKSSEPKEDVVKPTFNPEAGTYISPLTGLNAVKILCATPGAEIRYTTDGTDPNQNSTIYNSASPIAVSQATTIKARAYKDGMNPSEIAAGEYTFSVASLAIYPVSGNYTTPQTVQIQSVTPGTVIYYTLDGTDPTESSTPYIAPFVVNASVNIKAKGFITGWIPSSTASVTYNYNISTPVISPAGGTFTAPQTVTLTTSTPNAIIHYTTDGSDPTESSEVYTSALILDGNAVLKARGFIPGWNPSSTASATFTFNCTAPTFNLNEGTYNNPLSIVLATVTQGAVIRYTTDGSLPDETSTLYTGPVDINITTSLKAKAFKTNWNASSPATAEYILKVRTPAFNPVPGNYGAPLDVTITCATPDVSIYYTTNGDTPTNSSTPYTGPVTLMSYTILKARAYKANWTSSEIAQGTFVVSQTQTVETPVLTPAGGNYTAPQNVAINCVTNGATIRYTTDGSEPNASSQEYTAPLLVSENVTIKAKAFKPDWFNSSTASESYIVNFTLGQMIPVQGGTYFMGNLTATGYPADETPEHQVTVSSFTIGKYEVTQLEWQDVMGYNPSFHTGNPYNPVENFSWYEALVYCNKRSIQEALTPVYTISGSTDPDSWGPVPTTNNDAWNTAICNWSANGYRLPSEAEWEFAARGGVNGSNYLYSGSASALEVAWFRANSQGASHIMGHLMANQLGTHDMSGNVNEWCWDWYLSNYYENSPTNDPTGPDSPGPAGWRTSRGGDWDSYNDDLVRIKNRDGKVPYYHSMTFGMRIVRSGLRRH
ncbi:MAG: chitobiase/beta-hexosaminidase C-terminal domain-containing protein [Candidatus Cloacimonadaceae bacterium]